MLTGQDCERSRRQQALHCGHSGKSGQRGRRVATVLPQDFEDTVHARQLKALCRRVGRRMSRQGPGRSPSMQGLTHLNAARPREKSSGVPHCGSSKILSDLVSHRRATRRQQPCARIQAIHIGWCGSFFGGSKTFTILQHTRISPRGNLELLP